MRGAWAIAGRELGAAFGRPLAYAVLALFVATFAFLSLGFDDFLSAGVASLRGPMVWLWSCLLFVAPAVAMRTFAEEWRSGTWSVLGALPLRPIEVVLGKWLGAVGLLTAALGLTLPWPVALMVLGEPDLGPILGGYLGAWLGAAALAAIGVAVSAWTESVVIAFLGAFLLGLVPWLLGFALAVVPPAAVPLVEALSFQTALDALGRGVLDSRAVVLFAVVGAVALRFAVHAVDREALVVTDERSRALRANWVRTALWAVLGALVLHLSAAAYVRLDFTADGRYGLSDAARGVVAKLQHPLVARVYFTEKLDPPYHGHRAALLDLLSELDAASGGQIEVVVQDPSADEAVAKEALSYGVHGLPYAFRSAERTETRTVYLGLALLYGERQVAIDALPSVERMEYEVVRAIASLEADPKDRKVVGWWTGHGEPDPTVAPADSPLRDLWARLGERTVPRPIPGGPIPDDVDLLLIAAPRRPVAATDVLALDQFVMRGGRVLAFLSSFQPDFDRGMPVEVDHGLYALFGQYGLVLGKDLLLDRTHEERLSVPLGGRWVQLPHPLAPTTTALDRTIPAVRGLPRLVLPFASSVRPAESLPEGVESEVWASTDADSAAIKGLRTLDPTVVQRGKLSSEVPGPHPVVVALSGTFPSLFAERDPPPPATKDLLTLRSKPARLVVVGSADAVANDPELVLNAVDWLVEDPALIGLRSRMTGDPVLPLPSRATLLRTKALLVGAPLVVLAGLGLWLGRRR